MLVPVDPRHRLALTNLDRHDLGIESSLGLGGGGALLRTEREFVLLFAGDGVDLGQALGGLPHDHAGNRTDETILVHSVGDFLGAHLGTPARVGQEVGNAAHRLGPAGQDGLRFAVAHRPEREVDGAKTAAAGHVDGHGGDGFAQARSEGDLPRDVRAAARLAGAADDRLPYRLRVHTGPLEHGFRRLHAEVRGTERGQSSTEFPNRGSKG